MPKAVDSKAGTGPPFTSSMQKPPVGGGSRKVKSWRCQSFPGLDRRLEGHILAANCHRGGERWLQPESVVGSQAWLKANGGKVNRGFLENPERHRWQLDSPGGAVLGEASQQDPPVFGWQPPGGSRWSPARQPDGRRRSSGNIPNKSAAGTMAREHNLQATLKMQATMKEGALKRSGSLSETNRTILPPQWREATTSSLPPTPAYVRVCMRGLVKN
mmetsp:Transcript_124286/g.247746  ORF Transcript_124286/g.247746 Transcript_124286/m.247746 type:complete len:216 (+) Transcript_124286:85-732(+)